MDHEFKVAQNGKGIDVRNNADVTLNDVELNLEDSRKLEDCKADEDRNLGFFVYNGANVTINSGDYHASGPYVYMMWIQDKTGGAASNVVINGGTFTSNSYGALFAAYHGNLTINGGFFDQSAGNANLVLQNFYGKIVVKGGTFVNYNPKHHDNGGKDKIPYVAEGYDVKVEPQKDGKTWYTVVKEK